MTHVSSWEHAFLSAQAWWCLAKYRRNSIGSVWVRPKLDKHVGLIRWSAQAFGFCMSHIGGLWQLLLWECLAGRWNGLRSEIWQRLLWKAWRGGRSTTWCLQAHCGARLEGAGCATHSWWELHWGQQASWHHGSRSTLLCPGWFRGFQHELSIGG